MEILADVLMIILYIAVVVFLTLYERRQELMAQHVLSPEEFSIAMMQIENGEAYHGRYYDGESQHQDADKLMCGVLRSLGYGDGVDIFEKMHKWYS